MEWHREDLWYLLHMFGGFRYLIFFILAMLWMRLVLMVMENMTQTTEERRQPVAVSPEIEKRGMEEPADGSQGAKEIERDSFSQECTANLSFPSRFLFVMSTLTIARKVDDHRKREAFFG